MPAARRKYSWPSPPALPAPRPPTSSTRCTRARAEGLVAIPARSAGATAPDLVHQVHPRARGGTRSQSRRICPARPEQRRPDEAARARRDS